MKDTRIAKLIGEQMAEGKGIVGRIYIHSETGAQDDREGWIGSYDPEELEERGISAERAFDEDEGQTLFGADLWEGEIEGRKLRVTWPDDAEAHEVEIEDISAAAAALGRKGGSAKSEAKAKAVRENGKLGGRPPKIDDEDSPETLEVITVHADDGAEQTFGRRELGLADDRGYTRKEWLAALAKAGYTRKGIASID
jgi:hypothetical protein